VRAKLDLEVLKNSLAGWK